MRTSMPRFCCSRTTHLSPVALFTTDPLSVASIDAASASRSYHRKATGQSTATGRERNVSSSSAGPTAMDSSSNARVYLPNVCRSNRSIGFYVSAYAPRGRRTPYRTPDTLDGRLIGPQITPQPSGSGRMDFLIWLILLATVG